MPKRKLPNFLRPAETAMLLAEADRRHGAAKTACKRLAAGRDVLILQLGLLAGLRVSEMCHLRIEDVDLAGGVLRVVQGKGGKDRSLPIAPSLLAALTAYIGERTTGFVMRARGESPLARRTAQERVTALGVAAKLVKRLKSHTLRHTFACRLLESGATIYEVSELLGHSSIAITSAYLHCLPERLRAAITRLG